MATFAPLTGAFALKGNLLLEGQTTDGAALQVQIPGADAPWLIGAIVSLAPKLHGSQQEVRPLRAGHVGLEVVPGARHACLTIEVLPEGTFAFSVPFSSLQQLANQSLNALAAERARQSRQWSVAQELVLSIVQGLRRGFRYIGGPRPRLSEDDERLIAIEVAQHLKVANWRIEQIDLLETSEPTSAIQC